MFILLAPTWNDTKKLINLYGIAHALKYMHSKQILHRDLKPANILIDDHLYPKLCDFGLSRIENEENPTYFWNKDCRRIHQTELLGTPTHIAPEIYDNNQYSKAGDIYSYSLIVYEVLTTTAPFLGGSYFQIAQNIIENKYRPPIPSFVPDCYRQLIEDCWQAESKQRPTFDEIVDRLRNNHDFITENVDEDEYLDYIDLLDNPDKTEAKTYPSTQIEQSSLSHQHIEGNCDLS